jgi:RNA polymerase sigma factor (sigma-70 family)
VADTDGFEEFYTATVGRLLGQLYPVTGDLHEAEEIVQEAYARALAEALRALPMHQRQAIVLHHRVDLPLEEVAATLGARTGTVKSWLARGRRALADRLGEPEEVLS